MEQAIRTVARQWEEAWNAHDMSRLDTLLTDDADWVSVGGSHWKGRQEVERIHAELHQRQLRRSVWKTRALEVHLVEPGLALAHINWTIEGDEGPDGAPREPRNGVFTWVLLERSGRWLIRAAQGTNASG